MAGSDPTNLGKTQWVPRTKRHVVSERRGIPLSWCLTGANAHDSTVVAVLLDGIPAVNRPWGRPRRRPSKLHADMAYVHRRCRQALARRHTKGRIARKGCDASARMVRHRWVMERTLADPGLCRRLTIRYERRLDIHAAFRTLGCSLICFNALKRFCQSLQSGVRPASVASVPLR